MPHVTTILGNEVGVQYQGTRDASSLMGAAQVSGLIVGQFKRGRLDQPMTITLENVKGTLGEDLDNPDYLAVLDALASGVPSVQVMRVNSGDSSNNGDDSSNDDAVKNISCYGATREATLRGLNILSGFDPQVTTDIYVNGELVADNVDATFLNVSWHNDSRLSSNASALGYTVTGTSSLDEFFHLSSYDAVTFAFVPRNDGVYNGQTYYAKEALNISPSNNNSAIHKDNETGIITFCLSGVPFSS